MSEIDEIRNSYKRVFRAQSNSPMFEDLADYCKFLETTTGDPYQEAKRDVFLHILDMSGYGMKEIVDAIQKSTAYEKEEQKSEADNDSPQRD